ncbi:MAG: L-2-hydroxyglutarate oxidase [Azoarcus sp.]|jgi:L-2-hydroxyglutarate oxidase LhgO|nr:L-2-hydroxyglutarate oxidase [Azoarcus sp.]
MKNTCDFLIIGGGIIGLAIARELKHRHSAAITVLEKESGPGAHSSGRNSGVLHSGLYYTPGSLKAQLCRQGAAEMAAFHDEHGIKLNRCGKILTPTAPGFAESMATLAERARQNGVTVEKIDERQLRELEPETRSATGAALWVPDTAVGNPMAVIHALAAEVRARGADIRFDAEVIAAQPRRRQVMLKNGEILSFGMAINAAGLHADRIAHMFDAATSCKLLPFRGLYWKLDPASDIRLNHLIYPVPDLRILYLGVHTTTATDGTVYLGPTAVPAFGRENYHGFDHISWAECPRILLSLARMFIHDQDGFRHQAWQEGRRAFKYKFAEAARALLPRLRVADLLPAVKVGLHPRIFDQQRGQLLKDFAVENSDHAIHILGATSPAWTSAFPLARHLCDQYIQCNVSPHANSATDDACVAPTG